MSNSTLRLRELGCGGSFSFSCSDLNFSSALSHFTDDVGDDVVEADDSSDVDDEESYIEIALDHHHHHPKATHEECDGDRSDHVDYLRISFSSSFPFPDFSNHTTNPNTQDDTNIVSDTITDPDAVVTQAAASSSTTPISASSSTSLEDFGGSDHDNSPNGDLRKEKFDRHRIRSGGVLELDLSLTAAPLDAPPIQQ
ncbi:hypothetical protein ACLB2K_064335 [Fragaria x ananassa]